MSSEIAIKVENLSKCYQIYDHPRDFLKQAIGSRLQRLIGREPRQYFREFWVLKDISFEIKKGETVGIIGRNGCGKSTLLQMICGTLNPTSGNIQTNGRVAALLELGSGFNPEFTGRENVYMNAAVLGLSKEEIDIRFDDIVAFADIGEFIDQPVKTYSSGMMVRLAFAVVAHVDADILVIDEALAVGDAFFQQKCMRYLRDFQSKSGTVLFVSHDISSVTGLCDHAILLAGGSISCISSPEEAAKLYLEQLYADPARRLNCVESEHMSSEIGREDVKIQTKTMVFKGDTKQNTDYIILPFRSNSESFGDGGAAIIDAGFLDKNDRAISTCKGGQLVKFFIRVAIYKTIKFPAFGLMIKNCLAEYVFTEGTDPHFRQYNLVFREGDVATAFFSFAMPHLIRGKYFINVAFAEGFGDDHIQHCWLHDAIHVESVSSRLVHGYCGMHDIDMTIELGSREDSECQ